MFRITSKIMGKIILFLMFVMTAMAVDFLNVWAGDLHAGVAKINITKDKPAVLVNDPLYVKALVFDDGKTKAVIITLDVGGIQDKILSEVRSQVQKELKINGDNVLLNASHNHHTQGQVTKDIVKRTILAVKNAYQNMVPVRIGAGVGHEDRITMNRRLRLKNGKISTIRRANPCPQDDDVAGLGEFDPEIGILRIDRVDGKPLAVLYNFAGHAYGGVPNRGVTACFPGFASKVIEGNLGNGAIALFLQGAAGEITPILYKDVTAPRPAEALGTMLGLSTLKALKDIPVKKKGSIKVITEKILLPVRTDVSERIDSLSAQKEVIIKYFIGIGCGSHGAGTSLNFKTFLPLYIKYALDPKFPSYYSYRYLQEKKIGRDDLEKLDFENRRDIRKYLSNIHNMEKFIRVLSNLEKLKRLQARIPKDKISAEIQCMKIGDFVLITFPGEIFAQIGLNIKELSPYEKTFIAGYSNGSIGYAPTADAYDGEAYEDCLSKLSPEWQEIYEKKAIELIKKVTGF
ncbi:hypothetical protein KAS50_04800 [bacterium]|nr:hypothetical protein [bacterium]